MNGNASGAKITKALRKPPRFFGSVVPRTGLRSSPSAAADRPYLLEFAALRTATAGGGATMKKKWYNLFVVSNSPADAARVADAGVVEPVVTFDAPVRDTTPLDEIYATARIQVPPHGYTILKVAEMLESEHIRELPAEVRRKSVLVALEAAGVSLKEIVDDAVQRDRALDTYERVLEQNFESLRIATAEENTRLEAETEQRLRELRVHIEQNNQSVAQAREQLAAWRAGKRAEETRIAEAVGYFVSENPISRADGGQGVSNDVR